MGNFLRNNGLSITLMALFAFSIAGQALFGWRTFVDEQHGHDLPGVGFLAYLGTGHFLSATFENWESEFLSMAALVVLGIFLRERGSPESKPVAPPHDETGA